MISLKEMFVVPPIGDVQTIQSDHPIIKFKTNNSLNKNQINKLLKSKKTEITESDNQYRNKLKINQKVKIVKKKDQRTNNYTVGEIERFLTNKKYHSRGIKVKLKSGEIGRVQEIMENYNDCQICR